VVLVVVLVAGCRGAVRACLAGDVEASVWS
jgi:hypothetical protein